MYRCPECSSPRTGEKLNIYNYKRTLTLFYGNGCFRILEAENSKWKTIDQRCKGVK